MRGLDDRARPVDVHGVDLGWRIEGQGGRAVHHDARALQRALHGRAIPDVAGDDADTVALGIIPKSATSSDVTAYPRAKQVPCEVDPEETVPPVMRYVGV